MTRLRLALRAVADATLSFTFYSRFHRTRLVGRAEFEPATEVIKEISCAATGLALLCVAFEVV